ncbi:MAG: hypothetical protein UT24_C0034G0013 [Candidatus Woesebacteria bacterium GW2011_GWB1_39_12]|uniref:Uncharacterized protein n=1 Tax=Candidatus Woesebacteria bacterium GW2011_GWB1_39_12 TaxID=1618574 RepID=A0A0G0MER8_9BACT|nr:MAG: hypothetical protein UT24_C0034G0013 [Candidatus Woesebacteria bacterium GW2011_GWB1_39_12]
MPAPSSTANETPEATMARVKSELAASNTNTGITRQLNIERAAGLPSFTATGTPAMTKPSTTPVTPEGQFTTALQNIVKDKIEAKRNDLLKPDDNLDTQLALQRGAFYAALVGKADALTAEDLRWLSPSQQAAVRSGDKAVIEGAIVGLNSIMQTRKENKLAKNTAIEKANIAAMTKFNTLSELGMLDKLSEADQVKIESQLGLEPGAIKSMQGQDFVYKTSAGTGNSIIETKLNKQTGQVLSVRTIGGTEGFVIPSAPVPKQTFEEYLKQKEEEEQKIFGPLKREELRKEFEKQQAMPDYNQQFESVVMNLGSVEAQKNARIFFDSLLKENNPQKIESYLSRMALEGLKGKTLTDYNAMGQMYAGVDGAQTLLNNFSVSNPGLWKTVLEKAKPWVTVSKDQKWVAFTAQIEAAQAGYRSALFGAALTPQEFTRSNFFLVDFSRDDIKTVQTKMNGMKELSNEVRTRLINEQKGIFKPTEEKDVEKSPTFAPSEIKNLGERNYIKVLGGWIEIK